MIKRPLSQLKTLPFFYWKRVSKYSSTCLPFIIIILIFFHIPLTLFGEPEGTTNVISIPGIVKSLETIIQIENKQYEKILKETKVDPKVEDLLKKAKYVEINPTFLLRLLLRSPEEYLLLSKYNECSFYAALDNNLLSNGSKKVETVLVDIIISSSERKSVLLPVDRFLEEVYKKQCFSNKKISQLFTLENFKGALQTLSFKRPQTEEECYDILLNWKKNLATPYLCKVVKILHLAEQTSSLTKVASQIESQMSYYEQVYITNLCRSLTDEKKFCALYLTPLYWNKILNGEKSSAPLYYRCETDLRKCARELEEEDFSCHLKMAKDYLALNPMPSCSLTAQTLEMGRLRSDYQDCPGEIEHYGVVNALRIISHFNPQRSTLQSFNSFTCASNGWGQFYKMVLATKSDRLWNYQLCYYNKIQSKEICYPFYPESFNHSSLSSTEQELEESGESKIIAKILVKSIGAPDLLKCEILEKSLYKPKLLKFKKGCFLLYQKGEQCRGYQCPKEIVYDEKVMTSIKYKVGALYRYFATQLSEDSFSISNMLKEYLNIREFQIKNISDAQFYLQENPYTIIHGLGCKEDLLPQFFNRRTLSECVPLPFIIDGLMEKEGVRYMSVRTAIDNLHAPRLITWTQIYNSVRNFQEIHPQKTWLLYALKISSN